MPVVRGRIREAEQIRRRFGLMRADRGALRRLHRRTPPRTGCCAPACCALLRVPDLPPRLRHRLAATRPAAGRRHARALSASGSRSGAPPGSTPAYHPALRLAEVIVRASSFEQGEGGLAVHGFVIDMAHVFEDFVCTALGRASFGRAAG